MIEDGKLEIHLIRGEDNEQDLWTWELDVPVAGETIEADKWYLNPFHALFEAVTTLKVFHLSEYLKLDIQSYHKKDIDKVFDVFTRKVFAKKDGEKLILNYNNKKEQKDEDKSSR